jgi:hypothetical protein
MLRALMRNGVSMQSPLYLLPLVFVHLILWGLMEGLVKVTADKTAGCRCAAQ